MKLIYLVLCMLFGPALVLSACTDNKNPAQQYGNSMVQTYKSVQKIEQKVDLQTAQKSIQEFYAANGRYPADIKELSGFSGLNLDNGQYEYNPANGALTAKQ